MATLRQPPPRRRVPAAMRRPDPAAPPPKASARQQEEAIARRAARRQAQRRPSAGTSPWLVLMMGFVIMAFLFALPSVPILLLGMLPTAVAVLIDRSPGKTAALCVAGLNFAGVAPFIAALWSGPNTLGQSFTIMANLYTWLIMYGAAALGWLLYLASPPVVGSFLQIHAAQRVASLRATQARLREEWGIGTKSAPGPM